MATDRLNQSLKENESRLFFQSIHLYDNILIPGLRGMVKELSEVLALTRAKKEALKSERKQSQEVCKRKNF